VSHVSLPPSRTARHAHLSADPNVLGGCCGEPARADHR
jgi:hypothetical protein